MKKFLSFTLSVLMLVGAFCLTAFAEDAAPSAADVYVTIADHNGALALAQEKITVSDKNSDGIITIDEALFAAHEAKYEGGAAAGYASAMSDWGLSLTKLWGDESGNFSYYINNASAWGLTDAVKDGDYITAFVYTDAVAFTDAYCYFDKNTVSGKEGDEVTLTLSCAGYDASWNPVTLPVEGATITVNGALSEYKTDADGKVTFKLDGSGDVLISAVSETMTLVPPVCKASVEAKASDAPAGDNGANVPDGNTPSENEPSENDTDPTVLIVICVVAAAVIFGTVAFFVVKKIKNEK